MVRTRSGAKYEQNMTENINLKIHKPRSSRTSTTRTVKSKTNTKTKSTEYIYRTIHIEDMVDFKKIHQPYEYMFYVIKSNENKSLCIYGVSNKEDFKYDFMGHLIEDPEAISKLTSKIYLVMSNNRNMLYSLIDKMTKAGYVQGTFATRDFDKFLTTRDSALKSLQ